MNDNSSKGPSGGLDPNLLSMLIPAMSGQGGGNANAFASLLPFLASSGGGQGGAGNDPQRMAQLLGMFQNGGAPGGGAGNDPQRMAQLLSMPQTNSRAGGPPENVFRNGGGPSSNGAAEQNDYMAKLAPNYIQGRNRVIDYSKLYPESAFDYSNMNIASLPKVGSDAAPPTAAPQQDQMLKMLELMQNMRQPAAPQPGLAAQTGDMRGGGQYGNAPEYDPYAHQSGQRHENRGHNSAPRSEYQNGYSGEQRYENRGYNNESGHEHQSGYGGEQRRENHGGDNEHRHEPQSGYGGEQRRENRRDENTYPDENARTSKPLCNCPKCRREREMAARQNAANRQGSQYGGGQADGRAHTSPPYGESARGGGNFRGGSPLAPVESFAPAPIKQSLQSLLSLNGILNK